MNPEDLNGVMEIDHVVEITPGRNLVERPDIYAPDLHIEEDADGQYDGEPILDEGWTLLDGYSGQYLYAGPLMHSSEFIGGGLARDILDTPGIYVALACYSLVPEGCEDDGPHMWAVARRD